jgi:hypothetical protein
MQSFCCLINRSIRIATALALVLAFSGAQAGHDGPNAPSISASAAASPGMVVVGKASITYTARAGDTLISIAQQYTDKSSNWIALGKLNRIDRDSAIPVGFAILIPAELLGDVPAKATVAAMTGTITATNADGSTTRLSLGATVGEGTKIETGFNSFLTLTLIDQSRISVPSNSRIQLAKLRSARYLNSPRTQVTLLRGRVESRVTPLESNHGRYEVHTPLSVAGVRGTHFRVRLIEERAVSKVATETLEGKVAVTPAGASTGAPARAEGVMLNAAFGNITTAATVGTPIALLAAPHLAATNSGQPIFPSTQIALAEVPNARAYHVQLATDPELMNSIVETNANSATLALDGIADGQYYVRLTAIDRFGLEGMARIEAITLQKTMTVSDSSIQRIESASSVGGVPTPAAPVVFASDDQSLSLRWTPLAGQVMRLQLARDSDFSYLLANRISDHGQVRLRRPSFGTYYARVEVLDAKGQVLTTSLAQPIIVTDQWIIHDGAPVAAKQSRAALAR